MAKGFDILHVKSAVKARNKFDLSRTHLTTMDFGEIVPLFVEETVPGDNISVTGNYFSRMAPLVKPTYGKFSFKTMTAFVPYHQIAADADAWIVGKTAFEGETPMQRWFSVGTLVQFLITYCLTTSGATSANTVFNYVNGSGTLVYNVFTDKGKYWVKVLNALGYTLPEAVDLQSSSQWTSKVSGVKLSAYPLLAFFKAYNDYMSQSQRFNISALSGFLRAVKLNKIITGYNNVTGALSEVGMNTLFSNLFLNYENDYFVSAWQNQNSAIGTNSDLSVVGYVPGTLDTVSNDSINTKVYTANGTYTEIAQRTLDWLKSFDDWVRRNNYSGSRAVQEVYSRFGIKTDDYKCDYAYVLDTDTMPIQVGDVTATADATGVPLGDYAGKGIMTGSKGVSYKANDYGILLILGYFTVVPMQAFGHDRRVLRSSPLDYYTPEFDGLGADAISFGELYASPITDNTDTTYDTNVFGYTERYNAYRYGRDVITGEFRDYRKNGDMNVWHTGRNLTDIRLAGNMVAQSTAMNTLPQTGSEYNRIFSLGSGNENHFYVTAHFNVNAIRPMLNLNQVPRLGEGDTTVPRNGNVIS